MFCFCLFIAKAMVYHHALACISSPQAYIINRRLYRFRNDDIQHFVLCCAKAQRSRSNFACLAEKQAFRLGCAALSAPPALRFKSAPPKRKIRNTQMGIPYFWRRRKDLNLRAGYPTYILSRDASSPLEYFSIKSVNSDLP